MSAATDYPGERPLSEEDEGQIHYTDEAGRTRTIPLKRKVFTIGRSRDNDLSLNHRSVSPRHAEIIPDESGFTFRDKCSRKGSYIESERVSERPLRHGDSIRLGPKGQGALLTFSLGKNEPGRILRSLAPGLFQLNEFCSRLTMTTTRQELTETLRHSLSEMFPRAQVTLLGQHEVTDTDDSVSTFNLVLASSTQSWGACRISLRNTRFTADEVEFLHAISRQAGLVLEMLQLGEEKQKTFDSMIRALALTLDARDEMTAGHSARVANYSTAIARHLGFSAREQKTIWYAGLLHDYGKIGIREEVLCKPSKLTPEEYEHIKQHPVYTFHILSRINFGEEWAEIPMIASSHHERPDGQGYPRGLRGGEIHLGALILGVADFFDALTATRHYRTPMPTDDVVRLIEEGRDTQFDGRAIDAFKRYYEQEFRPRRQRLEATREQNAARRAADESAARHTYA
jgi:HD-GYP domain-containing protein (c-di-GMP phosphodiesterase class II)